MSLVNLNTRTLKRKVFRRPKLKKYLRAVKRSTVKNIVVNNKSGRTYLVSYACALKSLVIKRTFRINYGGTIQPKFSTNTGYQSSMLGENRSASLLSIKRLVNNNFTLPKHKANNIAGSHAFFSSAMSSGGSLISLNSLCIVNLLLVRHLSLSALSSLKTTRPVNYCVSLLSTFSNGVLDKVSNFLGGKEASESGFQIDQRLDFSFVSEIIFMKFFSNSRNLIRSSRRLALPKIFRKAVITGSKLSVDTYALNYFSYKIFLPNNFTTSSLVDYTNRLHLKSSLSWAVRLPLPIRPASGTEKLTNAKLTRFLDAKRPRTRLRKYRRRFNKFLRVTLRFSTGNFFKKNNLVSRLFRKKLRSLKRVRYLVNTLQNLDVYRSKFASLSSPLIYSYDKFHLPLPNDSSESNFGTSYAAKLLPSQANLPINEFSHQLLAHYLSSTSLMKLKLLGRYNNARHFLRSLNLSNDDYTNIYPVPSFRKRVAKRVKKYVTSSILRLNITPWYHNTLIRFFEHCSGNKVLLQYNLSVANQVDSQSILMYKRWMPRMASYERKLGHRFFLEEALHIIHLSFRLHDSSLISNWLKAMIKRISFWKTRSIFRFLKYLFNNYLQSSFNYLGVKGFKIRLKGKISAAGNSRKRNIIFRSGKTSYSSVNLKCLHTKSIIPTFTGVMGFQVWIFY